MSWSRRELLRLAVRSGKGRAYVKRRVDVDREPADTVEGIP